MLEQAGISPRVLEQASFAKGRGCSRCQGTGYRGRLGAMELMPVNARIRELAFRGASTQEIRKVLAANGMKSLYKDGMIKAIKGITTIEEVFRVAGKGTTG